MLAAMTTQDAVGFAAARRSSLVALCSVALAGLALACASSPPRAEPGARARTVTIGELEMLEPGVYAVDGWVVRTESCEPCAAGAGCIPCAPPTVTICEQRPIERGAVAPGATVLVIDVDDTRPYEPDSRYRFVVRIDAVDAGRRYSLAGAMPR
jgi:hypothetical protein